MIIGAMSACQRYKLIVRFNHMKKLEIQKVQKSAGAMGPSSQSFAPAKQIQGFPFSQGMPGQEPSLHGDPINGSGSSGSNYSMSQTTARYLHDMKIEKDEIEGRLEEAKKILEIELRKFKRYMVSEFQQLAQNFAEYQQNQAKKEKELWDAFRNSSPSFNYIISKHGMPLGKIYKNENQH